MTRRARVLLIVLALMVVIFTADAVFGPFRHRARDIYAFSNEAIVSRFIEIFQAGFQPIRQTRVMGVKILQAPTDMWSIQDIVYETKPDFIIETGTYFGGSALYFASLFHVLNPDGRVITIDLVDRVTDAKKNPLYQKYVIPVIGNSVGADTLTEVRRLIQGKRALVFLDSAHNVEHVLKELRSYAEFVPVGSYMVVHDMFFGRESHPTFGAGPKEAVGAFLKSNPSFEADPYRTRFLLTFIEGGYLKRVS